MHEKKPQKPSEHASEHAKSQNFPGACPHKLWAPLFVFALGPLNPVSSPASSEQIKGIHNQKRLLENGIQWLKSVDLP